MVFSNLSILLLFILVSYLVDKTAVNSICLGTYSSCFSLHSSLVKAFLEAGAKVKLVFLTGKKILKFFLEIFYLFASGFLINLSRNFARFAGCKYN